MTGGWDGTCGGGIWWSKARHYKNPIANELFLQVAVALHNGPGRHRLRELGPAGMGLVPGHRHAHRLPPRHRRLAVCKPDRSSPTWTYNQGVLIGGLVALARMTGSRAPLATAKRIAGAVMDGQALSPHGILRDPCEPASCDQDQPLFKGIFMKNLKLLADQVDRAGGASYRQYLRHTAWPCGRTTGAAMSSGSAVRPLRLGQHGPADIRPGHPQHPGFRPPGGLSRVGLEMRLARRGRQHRVPRSAA